MYKYFVLNEIIFYSSLNIMFGKLLISFDSDMNLAMDKASLFMNHVIYFGPSFDLFKVTTNSSALTSILIGIVLEGTMPIL